ncbi:MAG: hypothetical protein KJ977_05270 [Candidatus Omnitrophica bacterium]|nr:hypothetical protein [Candidatus Omnitrophota bacterium]MBU2266433.1 hypothetical protein [Candidatus Omnitrophota bacterium]
MSISLSEIRSDVRARVGDETGKLTNTLLNHWANIGQNVVYNQLLPIISPKLTESLAGTITANINKYLLPADCRDIRRVKVNGYKAREKVIDEIDSVTTGYEQATITEPAFLEWAGKIEIYPIPSQTGTYQVDYLKQIIPLVLDTDISGLPEEYHGLIVDYVEMLSLRKLNRGNDAVNSENTIAKMFTDILGANANQLQIQQVMKEQG